MPHYGKSQRHYGAPAAVPHYPLGSAALRHGMARPQIYCGTAASGHIRAPFPESRALTGPTLAKKFSPTLGRTCARPRSHDPCALPIADIAARLGGVVVATNMVRAPGPDAEPNDRSLLVTRTPAGLIVIPAAEGCDLRSRGALVNRSVAYVEARLASKVEEK